MADFSNLKLEHPWWPIMETWPRSNSWWSICNLGRAPWWLISAILHRSTPWWQIFIPWPRSTPWWLIRATCCRNAPGGLLWHIYTGVPPDTPIGHYIWGDPLMVNLSTWLGFRAPPDGRFWQLCKGLPTGGHQDITFGKNRMLADFSNLAWERPCLVVHVGSLTLVAKLSNLSVKCPW